MRRVARVVTTTMTMWAIEGSSFRARWLLRELYGILGMISGCSFAILASWLTDLLLDG